MCHNFIYIYGVSFFAVQYFQKRPTTRTSVYFELFQNAAAFVKLSLLILPFLPVLFDSFAIEDCVLFRNDGGGG